MNTKTKTGQCGCCGRRRRRVQEANMPPAAMRRPVDLAADQSWPVTPVTWMCVEDVQGCLRTAIDRDRRQPLRSV